MFESKYRSIFNSDDLLNPDLAFTKNKMYGGVLLMWKKNLDPYITRIVVPSSRFQPIIFNHPNHPVSIHIGIYLPTSGLDREFIHEISLLEAAIENILQSHPSALIYLRGDANAALPHRPGNRRDMLFTSFCERLKLQRMQLSHPTYHHFVGESSLYIDAILQTVSEPSNLPYEKLVLILCSRMTSVVDSKHDVILTTFQQPVIECSLPPINNSSSVINDRHRIIWSEKV